MQEPEFIGRSYIVSTDPYDGVAPDVTVPPCPQCEATSAGAYDFHCVGCCNHRREAIPYREDGSILLVWEDIFWAAHVTVNLMNTPNGKEPYCLDFKAYKLDSVGDDGPYYQKFDYGGTGDDTLTRDEARVFAAGDIKWDGCSNVMYFPGQPDHYEHSCGRRQATAFAVVMNRLFDLLAMLRTHNLDLID